MDQFGERHQVGHYSHKPRWRNDGHGFGEPLSDHTVIVGFQTKMVEMALKVEGPRSRNIGRPDRPFALASWRNTERLVWNLVDEWAKGQASGMKIKPGCARRSVSVSCPAERSPGTDNRQRTTNWANQCKGSI